MCWKRGEGRKKEYKEYKEREPGARIQESGGAGDARFVTRFRKSNQYRWLNGRNLWVLDSHQKHSLLTTDY